jgi:hypothetical protein
MAKCCGRERETAYCPDCGGKLTRQAPPLLALLAHVRKTAANHAKLAAEREADAPAGDPWAQRKRSVADRWQAWADALADALSRLDAPPPSDGQ